MEGIESVQQQAGQVAASQQQACASFFSDVEQLCSNAAEYLAELSKQAWRSSTGQFAWAGCLQHLGMIVLFMVGLWHFHF